MFHSKSLYTPKRSHNSPQCCIIYKENENTAYISVRLPRAIHFTAYTLNYGHRLRTLVNVQDHAAASRVCLISLKHVFVQYGSK